MRTPQKPFHAQLRLSSVRKLKMSLMEREAKWKDVKYKFVRLFLAQKCSAQNKYSPALNPIQLRKNDDNHSYTAPNTFCVGEV
mmetsp:Transcript_9886/g.15044  ORF Transcript_9886/g.15044 Transcript_9886/m.15044 type:complete len:83 (+) Transcript_9886:41-289(+)